MVSNRGGGGGVEILYLLNATETGDKCKPDGPRGSYADLLSCSLNNIKVFSLVLSVSTGACILDKKSVVHMAGEGRSFSSPGYPSYPGKGTCSWNITVSPGDFIKLTFWRIEYCLHNYVKVFDVTNSTRVLLGTFCSTYSKEEVYTHTHNVLVKFSSKQSFAQSGGFFATYESIKAIPAQYSCQITESSSSRIQLQGTSGEFASHMYPLPYSNDAKCLWEIERPVGYVVQFTFLSFDLQQSQDCEADYVEIKHGLFYWPTVVGKFCGSSHPGVIQVNDSKVYVEFKTDSSGKYPGFHASYKVLPHRKLNSFSFLLFLSLCNTYLLRFSVAKQEESSLKL